MGPFGQMGDDASSKGRVEGRRKFGHFLIHFFPLI
jgi:hypothetical protein